MSFIDRLTLEAFSLGHANDVDHFVLAEDVGDVYLLLEMISGPVDLVGHRPTIELDLHDVGLLLTTTEKDLLGVANHPDDLAVLLDLGQIFLDLLLAHLILPLARGLGESLLLRLGPLFFNFTGGQNQNGGQKEGERKRKRHSELS